LLYVVTMRLEKSVVLSMISENFGVEFMNLSKNLRSFFFVFVVSFLFISGSCGWFTSPVVKKSTINKSVREPEKYQATFSCTLFKEGKQESEPFARLKISHDSLSHRYRFIVQDRDIIYVEGAKEDTVNGKRSIKPFYFFLMPECNQYSESRLEEIGFKVPSSISPQELVYNIQKQESVEELGEENVNGRNATKFRFEDKIMGEGFVYLDKETGLPIRAMVNAQVFDPKTDYGDPDAERRFLRVVVDITDIEMTSNPNDYVIPQGMEKVDVGKLCPQVKNTAVSIANKLWEAASKTIPK